MRGGYRIIDFKKIALTSGTEGTIAGVYDAVQNPYGKALQVTGLVVGDAIYPDFYAVFTEDNDVFTTSLVIGGNTVEIQIAEDDAVTVTVTEPETTEAETTEVSPSVNTRKVSTKKTEGK